MNDQEIILLTHICTLTTAIEEALAEIEAQPHDLVNTDYIRIVLESALNDVWEEQDRSKKDE